jgi:hypothetical protein
MEIHKILGLGFFEPLEVPESALAYYEPSTSFRP